MDNLSQFHLPKPPKNISDRRLRTYKILLGTALILLLVCMAVLLPMVSRQSNHPALTSNNVKPSVMQARAVPSPTPGITHDKLIFVHQNRQTKMMYGNFTQSLFASSEIDILRDRVAYPFIDYFVDKGEVYITVLIEKDSRHPGLYELTGLTDHNGVYSQLLSGSGKEIRFWYPTCMGPCQFTAAYKVKYPEVVTLGSGQ